MEEKLYNLTTKRYITDLTGQRFGTRVVTEYSFEIGKFLCKCDCGKEDWVLPSPLKAGRGNTCFSCARKATKEDYIHPNLKDITGQTFGLWTVLHRSTDTFASKQVHWLCQCACGAQHVRSGASLKDGSSAGCRKCKAERMKRSAYRTHYYTMRRAAELRGIEWQIDMEYFVALLEKQQYKCNLTGLPIAFAWSSRSHQHGGATASLDRIDSSLSYSKSNLQWLHKDVNKMKMDLPQERFIELAKLITNNTSK